MYSGIYPRHEAIRAWLRDAHAMLAPADVVVSVGAAERHYAAHRVVLATHSGYLKAVLGQPGHPQSSIALPNLSPEAFAPLLGFMYTGYLELCHDNIYSILLAAHLLHMPRALDYCRAFLVHSQPLLTPEDPPHNNAPTLLPPLTPPLPTLVKPIPSRKVPPSLQTSAVVWSPAPAPTVVHSHPSLFRTVVRPEEDENSSEISVTDEPINVETDCPNPIRRSPESCKGEDKAPKVVLDVACCDGPVRFHRVLNDNYGFAIDKSELEEDDAEEDEARHREERAAAPPTNNKEPDPIYRCLYCNHTFKSHYCYQKHARRHINPVTFDLAKLADKLKADLVREVKLLDMNVQYYPCKTCGSKFPSYYFVHKHRRMCHPNEVEHENKEAVAGTSTSPIPSATTTTETQN